MRKLILLNACLLLVWVALCERNLVSAQKKAKQVDWTEAAKILQRIKAPAFANRDFKITDYGAKPDAQADNTEAIRQAIAACNKAGGGRVVVPPGVWLTGAIHLKSNVNLHVSEGATLKFIPDPAKYLPLVYTRWEGVELMNYSPLIYAYEQVNIAITGKGTLDGSASYDNWWGWNRKQPGQTTKQVPARNKLIELADQGVPVAERKFGDGSFLRPNFIQPYRSKNVLIEDVTILYSPMWEVNPVLCTNVIVRGLKVNTHGPNNDGCDPEASKDVLIENCLFDVGDDCIAIKSGRDDDGRRVGVAAENIIVRNCVMKDGHGGVVMGSEISGGVRNVFVEDCQMDSPNLDRALRFKSNARRGGVIENVFMRNVQVGRVAEAILTVDFLYETGANGPHKPVVRNVEISNVQSKSSPRVLWIAGFPGAVIDDIRFIDCTFAGVETAEQVAGIGAISFKNVNIVPAKKGKSLNTVEVKH